MFHEEKVIFCWQMDTFLTVALLLLQMNMDLYIFTTKTLFPSERYNYKGFQTCFSDRVC